MPVPAERDIPLVGDDLVLWKTDDASAWELPALKFAHGDSPGENRGNTLVHGNSYV